MLSKLSKIAWEVLKLYYTESTGNKEGVPAAAVVIQTFGDYLEFNPHLHILVSDSLFSKDGKFYSSHININADELIVLGGGSRLAPPHKLRLTTSPIVAINYIILNNRPSNNRLFQKSSENKSTAARSAPIEPERKLLQVRLQMARNYRTLMGAKDPTLKQA